MKIKRYLKDIIIKDLQTGKIVFLVGPRQIGKTWLSKEVGQSFSKTTYLNYDVFEDRQRIVKRDWLEDVELIIFDEIHKMSEWKNYLKGVYDAKNAKQKILVTGSARLDTFRKAGDSLAGRFYKHRMFPITLFELEKTEEKKIQLNELISKGGFPEALVTNDDIQVNRWRQTYIDSMIRDDVLDFETVHDFQALKLVLNLLRRQVGSTVNFSSISRDVGVSPATVMKYVQVLEALFIVFRINPFSKNIARSLLKEPKIYFYDQGLVVGDEGAKHENFVALSLLAQVCQKQDQLGEEWELKYLRTKDQHETDFALVKDNEVDLLIEVKTSDGTISKGLKYFSDKYKLPACQLVKKIKHEWQKGIIQVLDLEKYLRKL